MLKAIKHRAVVVFMLFCIFSLLSLLAVDAFPAMTGLEAHEKYIYPIVRCHGASGTIIYSEPDLGEEGIKGGTYSTYILTNYHVISNAIRIVTKWDSDLAKDVKTEKRSIIYVESFKYRDISTPIGTLKVEADIVLHNETEDLGLVKLRSEERYEYMAKFVPRDKTVYVMDETVAVGCSLGWPPLPTVGVITRLNDQIDSLPYHMSSSQIIYGNSGGAMFLAETGEFIGIPANAVIAGWGPGNVITHMGCFIPIERIYAWLEEEHYDFIYDETKNEKDCLELREKEIEAKKKAKE